MKEKKRFRALPVLAAAAAVIALSLLTELFVFNRHALFSGAYKAEAAIEPGASETVLFMDGRRYMKLVRIRADCGEDTPYRLTLLDEEGNTLGEREGLLQQKLGESVCNLRAEAAGLVLVLERESGTAGSVTVSDFVEWSPYRILFLAGLFGTAVFLWLGGRIAAKRPELAFAVICLVSGGLLIVMTGTNQISYDEQTHVAKAWNLSHIGTVYDTEAVLELKTLTAPRFHNRYERQLAEEYLQGIHRYDTANVFAQTKMIYYDRRAYVPMALFMWLGRLAGMPLAAVLMLGKLGNLLLYTAVCFFAVRLAKRGKGLVAVLALLPNSIFSASQLCYDACVNGFLLLGMVLSVNEFLEPEKPVRPGSMLAILASLIVGSYAKPVYMLMGLVLLFLKKEKFPSRAAAWLFRCALTALCLCMVYEVLAKSATGGSAMATLADAGDRRTEGSSMLGQIRYILSEPLSYAWLLIRSMVTRIADWFTGRDQFLMYAYLGTPGTLCTWGFFGTAAFAALVGCETENRKGMRRGDIALFAFMVFGMSAVVWTALYLSFNTVGNGTIEGVQDRYFTPVLFPLFACLMNGRLVWRRKEEQYYRILFGVMAAILFYSGWKLGIAAYYL